MALVCHTWLPWYSKSEDLFEHVSDLHKCSTCSGKFADLTHHKKRCQSLLFQCRLCYALFANYKHFFNHVRSFHFNICEKCNVQFETKEELDTHVWQIHRSKNVKHVFLVLLGGFLGYILMGVLGGILGGAFVGICGVDFFETEEDLNQHQETFIPGWSNPGWSNPDWSNPDWSDPGMNSTGPEWKPKKYKKERKKRNRKKRKH